MVSYLQVVKCSCRHNWENSYSDSSEAWFRDVQLEMCGLAMCGSSVERILAVVVTPGWFGGRMVLLPSPRCPVLWFNNSKWTHQPIKCP